MPRYDGRLGFPHAPMHHDAQFQYVEGQARPGFATLLPQFEAHSAAVAAAAAAGQLGIRYGEAARESFDFFPADASAGAPRATLVYFHAGYWQSRDKSTFRFIAPAFTRHGLHVALVNYPLCPHVALCDLLDAARRSVVAVRAHVAAQGPGDLPLVVSGHSAGGHIAAELGLLGLGDGAAHVDGVVALSGIYDLAPLVDTTLNTHLGLDAARARRYSPVWRVGPVAPPALFAVGGAETPAFLDQNQRMAAAWRTAGHPSAEEVVPGADHFSLLEQLVAPDSRLHHAVLAVVEQACRVCETGHLARS